jgi:GntR family histidine utilization transcriptional repressor
LDVQAEVLRRLHGRVWKPGDLLPSEAELAAEFGCARTTVNRALQAVAEEGLLERRRRGGTRVVIHPERKATFSIPVIRLQIEQQGLAYGYRLLNRRLVRPPKTVRQQMQVPADRKVLYLRALHMADEQSYALENRWIDLSIVPAAAKVDFTQKSPNEWLVENIPFSGGHLALSATDAGKDDARALGCATDVALFVAERLTHNVKGEVITYVQLVYAPGYRMSVAL